MEMRRNKRNPVLPGLYADPDLAVFGEKYYLYPTTDGFDGWSGWQFHVFVSDDGEVWKDGGMILDLKSDEVPWAAGHAWAPAIAEYQGRYYYYFCGKRPDGKSCIGAAFAETPTGPFTAMPVPLVTPELLMAEKITFGQVIDPSVYIEDGIPYLLFGNGVGLIVQLGDDMVSLVPGTMKILEGLYDFREAVSVFKRGSLYHFTWSCDDTGSEDYHVNYGTSDHLKGPVQYRYPILEKCSEKAILGTGHHSVCQLPGNKGYLIAYHRFGTPLVNYPEGKKGFHREVCLDSLTFDESGLIRPVVPTL